MLAVGAAPAGAQSDLPLRLDPTVAGGGTTLLIGVNGPALSARGHAATSLVAALPRGMRLDTRSRERLCTRAQAASRRCPAASRIGFGRIAVAVTGFLAPGGETELAWSIDAYLAPATHASDAASIVLRSQLLGADGAFVLVAPFLAAQPPPVTVTTGRVVRPSAGRYGLELRFPELPGAVSVRPPAVAAPTRLELSLGAVRRVRQPFVRRLRVRTPTGTRTQEIADHRLVGYDLLRTPDGCRGTWTAQLRLGFPGGTTRTPARIYCRSAS